MTLTLFLPFILDGVARPFLEISIRNINEDLKLVETWANKNNICLNMSKTKCIPIYKNKNIQISNLPNIRLDANNIVYLKTVKNLGLIFNNTFSWNNHIYASIGKLYGMLRTKYKTTTSLNVPDSLFVVLL